MAYGSYTPVGYQPMNYQQAYQPNYQMPMQNPTPAPSNNNPIIWVQGEAGAKSFLVAPNTTVDLWDSERQTIYLKSADASGMPSMKILDYTIRDHEIAQKPIETPSVDYATKEDLEALKKEIKGEISDIVKKEMGA